MGNPAPNNWPDTEDGKWYCVTTRLHQYPPGDANCTHPIVDHLNCCIEGSMLRIKQDKDWPCKPFHAICGTPAYYNAEEIENITGPFDSLDACNAACGG